MHTAIVLAGGSGSRVRREVNKVYLPIGGRPLLWYSLTAFAAFEPVERLVLVIRPEDRERAAEVLASVGVEATVVLGGPTRHASEAAGIATIHALSDALVAVHDGARPFLTLPLLDRLFTTAERHGGAVPGLEIEGPLERLEDDGLLAPADTRHLRRMQTPQVFRAGPLRDAYRRAAETDFQGLDTAETVEAFSDLDVRIVPGDPHNLKVTFVEDFFAAEDLARRWSPRGWAAT